MPVYQLCHASALQKAAEEHTPDAVREGCRKLANVEAQLAKALEEVTLLKVRLCAFVAWYVRALLS